MTAPLTVIGRIRSVPRGAFPGDVVHFMRGRHRSVEGRDWASGTEFVPLHGGRDNVDNRSIQVVIIGHETVSFSTVQEFDQCD